MAGISLKRSADDRRQRVGCGRRKPERLVDKLRGGREELLDLSEVVLPEREEELDGERGAQELNDQLSKTLLRLPGFRLLEQRDDLLELVEDDERPLVFTRRA